MSGQIPPPDNTNTSATMAGDVTIRYQYAVKREDVAETGWKNRDVTNGRETKDMLLDLLNLVDNVGVEYVKVRKFGQL